MKKCIFFDQYQEKEYLDELSFPFNCLEYYKSGIPNMKVSKYHELTGCPTTVKLNPVILEALMAYTNMLDGDEENCSPVGRIKDERMERYFTEYHEANGDISLVVATVQNREINFNCVVVDKKGLSSPYVYHTWGDEESSSIKGKREGGQAMLYCILPLLLKDPEAKKAYDTFRDIVCHSTADDPIDDVLQAAVMLVSNFTSRILFARKVSQKDPQAECFNVMINVPEENSFMSVDDIRELVIGENYSIVDFEYANCNKKAKSRISGDVATLLNKTWTLTELEGAFSRDNERQLTPDETFNITSIKEKLGEWYVVPKQVIKAALAAKKTYGTESQMNNFYFYGEAGGGKTSGAMALALALGIPYYFLTFSANTEIMDILQSVSPVTVDDKGNEKEIQELTRELPSVEDIAFDPVGSYEKLTGIKKEDVSSEEVTSAVFQTVANTMNSEGRKFKYVDSPLAKAFRYGGLCELQEPNIVSNPGVIVGINSLLDRTSSMVCANGEIVYRHKDFVAVDTTNRSYVGCRDVNASHLSRFQMALRFDKPERREMIERLQKNTGCTDQVILGKVLNTCESMCDILKDSGDSNYSCGMREMCAWVTWGQILGDYVEAAFDTIIPLATQNDDIVDELMVCVQSQF